MDRDDPTRRPITTHFEDETPDQAGHEHDQPGHEHGAAPAEETPHDEWAEAGAPIDDFADPEQAFAEEQIETHEGTELPSYAEGEGPIEEDYAEPEHTEDYVPEEGSDARSHAEEYLPKGMSEKGASPIMKYAPYGVVAIILAVLGFFGWQQVQSMMASSSTPTAMPAPVQQVNNNPPPGTQNSPQPAANTPTPLGSAPPDASQPQPAQTADGQPAPATRSPEYILKPDGTRQPMPPGGLPPEALGQAPAQPQAQPVPVQPQPVAVAPQPVAQPVRDPALENQVAMLNQQLDDMKRTQAQLQDQLQKAQSKADAAPLPSDVQAMQNKIAELEQKLTAEQNKPAPVAVASAPKPVAVTPVRKRTSVVNKPSNVEEQDTPPPVSEDMSAKPARARHHRARAHGDTEASRLQREMNQQYGIGGAPGGMPGGGPLPGGAPAWAPGPTMAVNAAGGGWIMRSAQPGSAWLSQGMSSDLTRVVPGDKVPGLGTIVSIRMVAGRWLVEGTQGSVR